MARGTEALVEPSLLVWARQSAGYRTTESAAQKAGFPLEQLERWENGEARPTVNQLRKLGQVYGRPLAVFYLPEPPKDFDAMHLRDYRRLPESTPSGESPELVAEIRRASYRREVVLDLVQEWEDSPPPLEAAASLSEDVEQAGVRIRELLAVPIEEQVAWESEYAALRNWRAAIEDVGVLVFQAWGVDVREMRGFSLTERPFPVIAVNVRDHPRGRIFSLMHELAHILLRDNGLCDLSYREPRSRDLQRVEQFCNSLAAAALIPRDDLLAHPLVRRKRNWSTEWSWNELRELSFRYQVSDQALLRRLLTLRKVDDALYWQTLQSLQRRHKGKRRTSRSSGGPHPSEKAVSNAGQFFTELVLDSYHEDRITAADLSDYLEVRLKHIPAIEKLIQENTTAYQMPS